MRAWLALVVAVARAHSRGSRRFRPCDPHVMRENECVLEKTKPKEGPILRIGTVRLQ